MRNFCYNPIVHCPEIYFSLSTAVFDGIPRTKQQIDLVSGGLLGEAAREANKTKMLYGLLKEPDINIPVDDDDDGGGDGEDKPKVKMLIY